MRERFPCVWIVAVAAILLVAAANPCLFDTDDQVHGGVCLSHVAVPAGDLDLSGPAAGPRAAALVALVPALHFDDLRSPPPKT